MKTKSYSKLLTIVTVFAVIAIATNSLVADDNWSSNPFGSPENNDIGYLKNEFGSGKNEEQDDWQNNVLGKNADFGYLKNEEQDNWHHDALDKNADFDSGKNEDHGYWQDDVLSKNADFGFGKNDFFGKGNDVLTEEIVFVVEDFEEGDSGDDEEFSDAIDPVQEEDITEVRVVGANLGVVDVNNDGSPDLVTTVNDQDCTAYLNYGDGTLSEGQDVSCETPIDPVSTSEVIPYIVINNSAETDGEQSDGLSITLIHLANMDGDNHLDAVVPTNNGVSIYFSGGNNTSADVDHYLLTDLEGGSETPFAGPRDEPFFVDLHVFDLLGVGDAPTTDGLNVMSLVLEVPIEDVTTDDVQSSEVEATPNSVIGVYARNLRRIIEIRGRFGPARSFGRNVQVSRLAFPLINEADIGLQDKDKYIDNSADSEVENFGDYFLNPVIVRDLQNLPLQEDETDFQPQPNEPRLDIVGILSPYGTTSADLLRLEVRPDTGPREDSGDPTLEDHIVKVILDLLGNPEFTIPGGDGVGGDDSPNTALPYLIKDNNSKSLSDEEEEYPEKSGESQRAL